MSGAQITKHLLASTKNDDMEALLDVSTFCLLCSEVYMVKGKKREGGGKE